MSKIKIFFTISGDREYNYVTTTSRHPTINKESAKYKNDTQQQTDKYVDFSGNDCHQVDPHQEDCSTHSDMETPRDYEIPIDSNKAS